jgi:hypothetical protein
MPAVYTLLALLMCAAYSIRSWQGVSDRIVRDAAGVPPSELAAAGPLPDQSGACLPPRLEGSSPSEVFRGLVCLGNVDEAVSAYAVFDRDEGR